MDEMQEPMKPSVRIAFVVAVALTVLADLMGAEAIATEHGELVLTVAVPAGLAWAWVCWAGARWCMLVALANATVHLAAWAIVAGLDDRTFFGGAMLPVLSLWGWLLAWLILTPIAVVRVARLNRKKRLRP